MITLTTFFFGVVNALTYMKIKKNTNKNRLVLQNIGMYCSIVISLATHCWGSVKPIIIRFFCLLIPIIELVVPCGMRGNFSKWREIMIISL